MRLIRIKYNALPILIFITAILFYSTFLWTFKEKIPDITINASSLSVMGLSILLSVIMISLGGFIWLYLLRDHKIIVEPFAAISIFAVSQFGKYLPGNIGQHVGRVLLAQRAGIPIHITLNTMIVEGMWGVASGCGLALLSISFFIDVNDPELGFIPGRLALILLVFLLLTLPWIGIYLVNTCFPSLAKRLTKSDIIPLPKVITAIIVSILCIMSFTIMGLILKLQAQWFFGINEGSVFELTCLFAIAWLAGYLVPGAPAGLGVREAMMVLLLSPVLGGGTSVGLSITLRVTTTLGDAVAFLIGFWLK